MLLKNLIAFLASLPDGKQVAEKGLGAPSSYRGSYDQLAFPIEDDVTVDTMLAHAKAAVNQTFNGYKGGQYKMTLDTECWIADWGAWGDEEDTMTEERLLKMFNLEGKVTSERLARILDLKRDKRSPPVFTPTPSAWLIHCSGLGIRSVYATIDPNDVSYKRDRANKLVKKQELFLLEDLLALQASWIVPDEVMLKMLGYLKDLQAMGRVGADDLLQELDACLRVQSD